MNKHSFLKALFVLFAITVFAGYLPSAAYSQNGVSANKIHNVQAVNFNKNNKPKIISNNLFSITMPQDTAGLYKVKKQNKGITIYDKASDKAGFGGLAFGVRAYKNPSEHAMMPGGIKIGELVDKKGNIYDMVLYHPTDVQYDYTKGTEPSASYKKLYELGDVIDVQGRYGAKYFKNQGMKGENLYKDILQKHITAIEEKWDSQKLEKENMSYMYNVLAQSNKNLLNKIGYTYYDSNGDGIDELLIGEIADGAWKGVIYDMYTMVDRKPMHVLSGGSRNRFYACDGSFICNEYSAGALESGMRVYILVENSIELFPQVEFKYDGYENKKQPWFLIYGETDKENVTEQKFNERKKVFESYIRFNYTPLNRLK